MIVQKQFSCVRSVVLPMLGLALGVGVLAIRANAANFYLDVNGATSQPASGVTSGSTYHWNDPIWTNTSAGNTATINYVNGNFPRFAAGTDAAFTYTITLDSPISCVGMFLEDGNATDVQNSFSPPISGSMVTLNGTGTIAIDGGAPQGFIVRGSSDLMITNQIIDGTNAGNPAPGGISFSTSGGTGGGSLYLYSPTGNTYSGGTVLATSGGLNILNSNSLGTGPISWSVGTAVIAYPHATAPINLTNTINGRSGTPAASSLVLTGSQPLTVSGPVNFAGGVTQTIQVGNTGFPAAQVTISSAINAPSSPLVKSGPGTLTLTNGSNNFGNGLGNDTSVTGGTLVVANPTAIPATFAKVDDTGSVPPSTATLQYAPNLSQAGAMFGITFGGTGRVDITNNAFVVTGGMTAAQVVAALTTGFNGGAWNGPGIDSSTAANDTNGLTAIGYADNADYGASSFHGVPTPNGNEILMRYTYYGDADLDGKVTLDDFSQFLNGYQAQSAATNNWLNGDFDYSGSVTLDDFSQFLFGYQHQGAPLGALESMIESSSLSAADKALMLSAIEAVPEPGSIAILGLAAGAFGLSRRRRGQA